ncbi:hypothetical protein [Caulobacter sp. 17J80-11]|uniref:hypothetical protein n=1 Tax=Caulobacter sp. 17J80-11 TaxID=2763502 RepID=UPI00165364D8|nr:hypothetical protein [Caulobacter sp. 17J80-11]MBC6980238.1 hypothetical protein [Caulobacter sp. 17J80-11]
MISRVFVATLTGAALVAGAASADAPKPGMPYKVTASKDTFYALHCKFPATKVDGIMSNSVSVKTKGPNAGTIPAPSGARCSLTKLAGAGPVVLTITKGGAKSVTAENVGQEMKLTVF